MWNKNRKLRSGRRLALLSIACLAISAPAFTQSNDADAGQVQLPLALYHSLVSGMSPSDAATRYAIGNARIQVRVDEDEAVAIQMTGTIQVLAGSPGWHLVPLLPIGTVVESASINGQPIQLIQDNSFLSWPAQVDGAEGSSGVASQLSLSYRVQARPSGRGYVAAIPIPQSSGAKLTADLPGGALDLAVIPSANLTTRVSGNRTLAEADIASGSGIQLTWQAPLSDGHTLSRASYQGVVDGESIRWSGEIEVELFGAGPATVPLFPRDVTLSQLRVDGKNAPILDDEGHFSTTIAGRGRHRITVGFRTAVKVEDGPSRARIKVPPTPVSEFTLTLPGNKEISTKPAASVNTRFDGQRTLARVFAPMTRSLTLSWSEAVPDAAEQEPRASATLYHVAQAEEGVLSVTAWIDIELSRGELEWLDLTIPKTAQLQSVRSETVVVNDWQREATAAAEPDRLRLFLDRKLRGAHRFVLVYDQSLPREPAPFLLPLLSVTNAQRQKGIAALVPTDELALNPSGDNEAMRVGANQLPSFVREQTSPTIAHTFKYMDSPVALDVETATPDPVAARYDTMADSLLSVGEVNLSAATSVLVDVKSGTVETLTLTLPDDVNLLSLTAPSLRDYLVDDAGDGTQQVEVQFTQEMEGQFRIELSYERILSESASEIRAPVLLVSEAEVSQGRLALQALSAMEVSASEFTSITPMDVRDLPRQLVLKTTNPILLAYKYIEADTPPELVLSLQRHELVSVQEAAIDVASYRTLFTEDGLQVTLASFTMRNERKQFLRVVLPPDSQVWAATVNGRAEKPAIDEDDSDDRGPGHVLIKIPSSTEPFQVELTYATQGRGFGPLGRARATLAQPDILATETRWDVYLPLRLRYGTPSSNLILVSSPAEVSRSDMEEQLGRLANTESKDVALPLLVHVPSRGTRFSLEKVYANQLEQELWLAVPYTSASGNVVALGLNTLAILLCWTAIGGVLLKWSMWTPRKSAAAFAAGMVLLWMTLGVYRLGAGQPALLAILAGLGWIAWTRRHVEWRKWLPKRLSEPTEPTEPSP